MRSWQHFSVALFILLAGCLTPSPTDDDVEEEERTPSWHWQTAAPLNNPRGEAACATDGERHLLIAGGLSEAPVDVPVAFGVTASAEIYDATQDQWEDAPGLPVPVHHPAVSYAAQRWWISGGYPGPTFTPSAQFLSWGPGETTWTVHDPMPVARGAHGAAVVGDSIILVGGVTPDGVSAQVHAYNTTTDEWTALPDAPTPREHLAVDAKNATVYVAGGRDGEFDSTIDAFDILDTRTMNWSQGPPLPTPRGGSAGAGGTHGFIVAGGEATGKTFEEIERYDAINGAWQKLPDDPDPRHGLCIAQIADRIHIISGGHEPGFHVSDTHNVLVQQTQRNGTEEP